MHRRLTTALPCLLAIVPPAQAAGLPGAVASRGSLAVAVVPNRPLMEFRDPATDALAGFDIEPGEALPHVMERKPRAYAPLGAPISTQFTGIAPRVEETGLQQAVAAALDGLIAGGTYRALLATWHLADSGLERATINAGR